MLTVHETWIILSLSFDGATTQTSGMSGSLYLYNKSPRFVNGTAGGRKLLDSPQGTAQSDGKKENSKNFMQVHTTQKDHCDDGSGGLPCSQGAPA